MEPLCIAITQASRGFGIGGKKRYPLVRYHYQYNIELKRLSKITMPTGFGSVTHCDNCLKMFTVQNVADSWIHGMQVRSRSKVSKWVASSRPLDRDSKHYHFLLGQIVKRFHGFT
jgi:hypothetical protein